MTIGFNDERTRITSIQIRFDCSQEDLNPFINSVCRIFEADTTLAVTDRHGRVLEPTPASLRAAIDNSPAGKVRLDPKRAILEAAAATRQDDPVQ